MKDNRGFTLVELLAVIVMIAVLSVVAVSTYRGINESSKQKTLEAKISQIESAAEKWARENNITNRMNISVNTLVVEGYLSADEADTDGLSYIKNPVTGENMICNTVDITFKDGIISSKFNSSTYNCKLASQSLVDSNIKIRVVSSTNDNLTGTGSIAKWTNKDVLVIVNSDKYDAKATSISYDFEGTTITKNKENLSKYTGTNYLTEAESAKYYNVYYISSGLLINTNIVVTYDIPGEGTKSRFYTIRFDKEEATATIKSNSEWITEDSKVQITADDGKGSGPAAIYISKKSERNAEAIRKVATPTVKLDGLEVGKYYIWTEDKVGNISTSYKVILEINNVDKTVPDCKVNFYGEEGDHGWYKKNSTEPIGVTPGGETIVTAGISGINVGVNTKRNEPEYVAFAKYGENNVEGLGRFREAETPKEGTTYYCHVKTLAGTYRNNTRKLYFDKTPPRLNIIVDNPNTHEQYKTVHLTISDTLSGLNTSTTVKYGLSQSNTIKPTTWTDITVETSAQNSSATQDFTTTELVTGTWYLWIEAPNFKDYAGNLSVGNNNGTTYVFGPYKFDNTPPVCGTNNGKTNWTNGAYLITQNCLDNKNTEDQSGCKLPIFVKAYLNTQNVKSDELTIEDKAGNTTICPHDVYIEHIAPSCTLTEPGPDGNDGWYKSESVTISAEYQDNGDEEIQSKVKNVGVGKEPNLTNGATSVTFTENGAALIAIGYVEDNAGNTNDCNLVFKKDDGIEIERDGCISFNENRYWTNLPVSFGVRVKTMPVSKCAEVHGENYYHNNNCVSTITIMDNSLKNATGKATFQTYSGAIRTCPYDILVFHDSFNPACGETEGESTTWQRADRTVSVGCLDYYAKNDRSKIEHEIGCREASFSRTFTSTTKVGNIIIQDGNNNRTSCPVNVFVDKTKPICGTVTGESTDWTKDDREISVACSDEHSKCSQDDFSDTFKETMTTAEIEISDNVGNTNTCTVNAYVDKTPPKCGKAIGSSTKWTNGNRTITISCSDSESHCSSLLFQKEFDSTTKTGIITISDKVGNTTDCEVNVYVDKTGPTCGTVTGESTDWTKDDREISVACSDADSECKSESFSNTFKNTATTSEITIKDNAGNTTNCSVNVYIDKTAPTCGTVTGGSTTWTSSDREISVACSDAQSDCSEDSFSYTFDTTTKTSTITISDNVGNTRTCDVNVYVDKIAPTCGTVTGESTTWTSSDREISVACSDSDSECSKESFSQTFKSTTTTSEIQISDSAGNTANCPVNVYVDKTGPTCSVSKTNTGTTGGVTCTVTCSDGESGCVTKDDDQGGHSGVKTDTEYTVKDGLGNTGTCTCYVTSENCNCETTYGDWGDWSACTYNPGTRDTDTRECTECGSQGMDQCRFRSKSTNCSTCYK